MQSRTKLEDLGWNDRLEELFEEHRDAGLTPARVAQEHRGGYVLYAEAGEYGAAIAGRLRHESGDLPVVGDWVAVTVRPDEGRATIQAVLPRQTKFSRKTTWLATEEQVLAANLDAIFLVAGLDRDFNPRRLERYLTMAWESGAQPVVVLTKADLCSDLSARVAEAEAVAVAVPVHPISNVTGAGIEALDRYLDRGRTVALLGSSGVGKSTLANRLLGEETYATQETRSDGRGRHTTTHRELVRLPSGALLIDTPGIRELQLWDSESGFEASFEDITELAARCRFADCGHETEPGCAVRAALADGTLDEERFASYRKLQRELAALEIRRDARLKSEQTKEWRRQARMRRNPKRY